MSGQEASSQLVRMKNSGHLTETEFSIAIIGLAATHRPNELWEVLSLEERKSIAEYVKCIGEGVSFPGKSSERLSQGAQAFKVFWASSKVS